MPLLPHILRWLLDSALAAALVLTLGSLLSALTRLPARRQLIGNLTLTACLLVALLTALPLTPKLSLSLLDPELITPNRESANRAMLSITAFPTSSNPPIISSQWKMENRKLKIVPSLPQFPDPSIPYSHLTLPRPLALTLIILYLLAVLLASLRLLLAHRQLRCWLQKSQTPDLALAALWRDLTAAFRRAPCLRISSQITRPLTFGVLQPAVLIPSALAAPSHAEQLRLILHHELTHIRRRHALTWLAASLVELLFFYQPLFYFLRRQVRLAQELIADSAAAEHAESPAAYAHHLLQLLQKKPSPIPALTLSALAPRSEFYRRMHHLLTHPAPAPTCSRRYTLTAILLLALTALTAGSLTLQAHTPKPSALSHRNPTDQAEQRALTYLLNHQEQTGGWMSDIGPAPTALVLKALLQSGLPANSPPIQSALIFLDRFHQPDHGYYRDAEPAYNTAIVLSALVLLPGQDYTQKISQAKLFLKRHPDQSLSPSPHPPKLTPQDSSLPLLYATLTPRPQPFANPPWMDTQERSASDTLPTYGSLTYADLKNLLYAGLTKDDARVRQTARWLAQNWTLDTNPGLNTAEGQFYFYHLAARTLAATHSPTLTDQNGRPHNWPQELQQKLLSLQSPNGSWQNSKSPRWLEDRPILVTAYSLLALQATHP